MRIFGPGRRSLVPEHGGPPALPKLLRLPQPAGWPPVQAAFQWGLLLPQKERKARGELDISLNGCAAARAGSGWIFFDSIKTFGLEEKAGPTGRARIPSVRNCPCFQTRRCKRDIRRSDIRQGQPGTPVRAWRPDFERILFAGRGRLNPDLQPDVRARTLRSGMADKTGRFRAGPFANPTAVYGVERRTRPEGLGKAPIMWKFLGYRGAQAPDHLQLDRPRFFQVNRPLVRTRPREPARVPSLLSD